MRNLFFLLAITMVSYTALAQSSDNIYDRTGKPSKEGLSRVEYDGKFGFIDSKKREVIEVQYASAEDFNEGISQVSLNGKEFVFINTSGKVVVPLKYQSFNRSYDSDALTALLNGKWGMITSDGKTLIPHLYSRLNTLSEGLAVASLDGVTFGFVNAKGKEVIPFIYRYASSFSEGLARVRTNGKNGYINQKGEVEIALKYDDAQSYSEGLAGVLINGKYGFIDKNDKLLIPAIFSKIWSFSNGEAEVLRDGEAYKIDRNGKRLNPGQYLMLYTKGLNMGKQYWNNSEKLPGDVLKKKYDEGYRLTDYVYNQHSHEIFVTMSNANNYMQTGISYNNTPERLWDNVAKRFSEEYNTAHITFGNGKWSFHATKLPRQQSETRIAKGYFPSTEIKKEFLQGKFITTLAYGNGQWMVIMRNVKYSDQQIVTFDYDNWDNDEIQRWLKKGYAITELAKAKSTYTIILTKGIGIKDQLLVWEENIPVREISKYWDRGYALYKTFYVPRWVTIGNSNIF